MDESKIPLQVLNEINKKIAAIVNFDQYVIEKRGYFYRPEAKGYTASILEAWRLPYKEAKRYELYADRDDVPGCEKVLIRPVPTPNYCGDLNFMAEAEKLLSDEEHTLFRKLLFSNAYNQNNCQTNDQAERQQVSATAYQRAIAFLRTKNQSIS